MGTLGRGVGSVSRCRSRHRLMRRHFDVSTSCGGVHVCCSHRRVGMAFERPRADALTLAGLTRRRRPPFQPRLRELRCGACPLVRARRARRDGRGPAATTSRLFGRGAPLPHPGRPTIRRPGPPGRPALAAPGGAPAGTAPAVPGPCRGGPLPAAGFPNGTTPIQSSSYLHETPFPDTVVAPWSKKSVRRKNLCRNIVEECTRATSRTTCNTSRYLPAIRIPA